MGYGFRGQTVFTISYLQAWQVSRVGQLTSMLLLFSYLFLVDDNIGLTVTWSGHRINGASSSNSACNPVENTC